MKTTFAKLLAGVCLCVHGASCLSADFILSEEALVQLVTRSPEYSKIENERYDAKAALLSTYDQYTTTFGTAINATDNHEHPVNSLIPVTKRHQDLTFTLNKPTPYGVNYQANYLMDNTSNSLQSDIAKSLLSATVSLDLFKNFNGKLSKAQLAGASANEAASALLHTMQTKRLAYDARKLYWSYIGATESKAIAEQQLAFSNEQLALTQKKFNDDIADEGDIARFSSQVSERSAQVLQYESNLKQLESQLKTLLPPLQNHDFSIQPYDKDATLGKYYQCLAVIESHPDTPTQYSLLDPIIQLRNQGFAAEKTNLSTYSDFDLSLDLTQGFVGTGVGRNAAQNNLVDDKQSYSAVKLNFFMNLGDKKQKTQAAKLHSAKAKWQAAVNAAQSDMQATHSNAADSIKFIRAIIDTRLGNSNQLQEAVLDSKQKFADARITSQQLVAEQNNYLNNELGIVDTKVRLLHFLLDYFATFTELPCPLNEIDP